VFAILADHPEVNPGETVTLTPYLSDLKGQGRAIVFSSEACVDPGVGYGAEPTCAGQPTRAVLAFGADVTGLSAPDYTGAVTSTIAVPVPDASVLFAGASDRDRFNGVNYLVTVDFGLPDGSTLRAFRRIVVSTRPTKNTNPAYGPVPIADGGGLVPIFPTTDVALSAGVTPGSIETFSEIQLDGTTVERTETIETTWYISEGDLSLKITNNSNPTVFTPPATRPSDHNLVIVIITRDKREGVTASRLAL
jgi:hypothetical protein